MHFDHSFFAGDNPDARCAARFPLQLPIRKLFPSLACPRGPKTLHQEGFLIMTRRYDWKNGCAMLLFLAVTATASTAQGWAPITFTTLFTFDTTDGLSPTAALIQGPDGNFYGTTLNGGADCTRFALPGCGTVFKITPAGALTTLYSFCAKTDCSDGAYPQAGLLLANDGNFYGTTLEGGENCKQYEFPGCGTVFKISPAGKLTTLYSFCSQTNCVDGSNPEAGLIQAADGDFYGTTTSGGIDDCETENGPVGCGTIFKITAAGVFTLLQQLDGTNGFSPSGLIQASDLNLYATTLFGGPENNPECAWPAVAGCGTVFKITAGDRLITLHNFCAAGCSDGAWPGAGLLQATNGDLYGTNGDLYGTGDSTVFRLSGGLRPFVAFVQSAGRIGQSGGILGQGFTGTTGVFLNGTSASFTVVSDTYIRATVPVGASSRFVTVDTPSGTLTSNVPFRVVP